MKNLKDMINERYNGEEYRVAVNAVQSEDGTPVTVTMVVPGKYKKQFEKWLEDQEGDQFAHANGGAVEY